MIFMFLLILVIAAVLTEATKDWPRRRIFQLLAIIFIVATVFHYAFVE